MPIPWGGPIPPPPELGGKPGGGKLKLGGGNPGGGIMGGRYSNKTVTKITKW